MSRPPLPELDYEAMSAQDIVALLLDTFHGKVALACSFQKEETVLLDMLFAHDPQARVFAIDTHHLFPETHAYWRAVEQRYSTTIERFAGPAPAEVAAKHGEALWDANPDLYLAIAKVAPLVSALDGLDAWITGIRRDQAPTRANAPKLGWDEQHELWKANPLADWDDDRCWDYIKEHELPYNALHDQGYESIGDTHSTQPGAGRSGRWAGLDKTECGIHTVASTEVASLVHEEQA
jgi:phosphoadenosine phosphosulfate reductase